jgi:membrane protease YdiL (CAAX protease family)
VPSPANTDTGHFSIALGNRPAGGLYLLGWLLSGLGLALFFVAPLTDTPLRGILLMAGLLLLIFGLAAAAGYQVVARRARATGFRGPSPFLLFALQVVLVNTISLALVALGLDLVSTGPGFLISGVLLFAGYVLVVWLFGIRIGALSPADMGVPRRPGMDKVITDVLGGAGLMLAVAFVASLVGGIIAQLIDTTAPEVLPLPTSGADVVFVILAAVVLIPIGEELLFRGYAIPAWSRDLGVRSALIRSTIFFALVHIVTITSPTFVDGAKQALLVVLVIGPVGFTLGWLFVRRGLVAAISGHAAFNLFGVLVLVLAQNLPDLPVT